MTEFGRSLLLKAGTTLSKVEYVKRWIAENTPILLTHVGANQFYTEVYLPDKRRHRFDLADCNGKDKDEEKILFDIAGPLCFQGDYLAKQVCYVQYVWYTWLELVWVSRVSGTRGFCHFYYLTRTLCFNLKI